MSGLAVEHAVTRTVRDSAALLDAVAGPDVGDPYPAPAPKRPFLQEVGADPGRLRVAFFTGGGGVHPDCIAAVHDVAALCESLGHEVAEASPRGLDPPELGRAMTIVYRGALSWIVGYWVDKLGRVPGLDELEPLTRRAWDAGRAVTAEQYLLGVGELQPAARDAARFLAGHDVWLLPTLARPPLPIAAAGTDPADVAADEAAFMATPGGRRQHHRQPGHVVPLHENGERLPIGVDFLGRFGDEATLLRLASQLEQARPWAQRRPPAPPAT